MSTYNYEKNAVLAVHGNCVYKTIRESCSSTLLMEKHQKIHEIAKSCGFIAPALIKVDGRVLHMQRLDLPCSLVTLVRAAVHQRKDVPLCLQALAEAGRVLACIHTQLTVDTKSPIRTNDRIEKTLRSLAHDTVSPEDTSTVCLHGDYALNNLFFGNDELTVLDPMPNYHTTFDIFERGSRYLEIALLVNSIHRQVGYLRFFTYDAAVLSELTSVFVSQYAARAGVSIDMEKVMLMSCALDNEIARSQVKGRVARFLRRAATRKLVVTGLRRFSRVIS